MGKIEILILLMAITSFGSSSWANVFEDDVSCINDVGEVFYMDESFRSANVSPYMALYIDTSASLGIDEVVELYADDWELIKDKYIQHKRSKGKTVWFKLAILNPNALDENLELFLSSDILQVAYYQFSDNRLLSNGSAGLSLPPLKHALWNKKTSIPIVLEKKGCTELYLRIDGDDLYFERFFLATKNEAKRLMQAHMYRSGILFGVLGFIGITTLLILVITRSKVNLYYSLYCITNIFSLFVAQGYYQYFVIPDISLSHYLQFILVLIPWISS